ncbi:hypothetical protein ACIQUL_36130 [Streptomyces sp. NPDC090303]|uniref:hypothetical protein n=1 Tax=Streptomyces sp. NPDC090303 TaxID=3365960 RepID=UPI0037F863B6
MEKTLPSGIKVRSKGRCWYSLCDRSAEQVVTFQSEHSTRKQVPLGYCSDCIEQWFLSDEEYEQREAGGRNVLGTGIYRRSWYEIREPSEVEAAELAYERDAEERWKAEGRVGKYRRIVELHQAAKVDGFLVDAWTAAACVKLHDTLNEANRKKWLGLDVRGQCHVAATLLFGK